MSWSSSSRCEVRTGGNHCAKGLVGDGHGERLRFVETREAMTFAFYTGPGVVQGAGRQLVRVTCLEHA
jgi:hypothetical protein